MSINQDMKNKFPHEILHGIPLISKHKLDSVVYFILSLK